MARKRSKYKRRRTRGRFAFLYKALTFLVICGAIAVALAFFFKVETIVVTGNARYSEQQIVEASGLHIGDNMFLLNKFDAAERIRSELPYVEAVRISRQLPDTLHIVITESASTMAVEQNGRLWLFCNNGKLVEDVPADKKTKCTRVTGLTLKDPQPGRIIEGEDEAVCQQLLELMELLNAKEMLTQVQAIHLEDPSVITLRYKKAFDVQIPWHADFDYKLNYLAAVIEKLEENEKGTIVLTQDGEARFIPD